MSKELINFDNNAYTFPEYPKKFVLEKRLSGEQMTMLRKIILEAILSLTNIPEESWEDYNIFFTISGSAANDTIIQTIMNVYEEQKNSNPQSSPFGILISTNVEHLSTIHSATKIPGEIKVVDVVNKRYDILDSPARLIHFIVANNETGIIYTSLIEKIKASKKNKNFSPIISADTIQCLGKTSSIDYTLFDIFTFTSQKLFGSVGLSGFVYKKFLPFHCPTYMLNQLQCEQLLCGIKKITNFGVSKLDEYFTSLEKIFFQQIRDMCEFHEIDCVICYCEPNLDLIDVDSGDFV